MNVFFLNTFLSNFIIFLYRNSLINFFIDNEDQLLLVHAIAIPFSYILWNKTTQYIHKLENNNRKTNRNCHIWETLQEFYKYWSKSVHCKLVQSLPWTFIIFSSFLSFSILSLFPVCVYVSVSPFPPSVPLLLPLLWRCFNQRALKYLNGYV